MLLRSRRGRRLVGWVSVAAVAGVAGQLGAVLVIFMAAVSTAAPAAACPVAATESLSIMGPPLSTPDRVTAWWGDRSDPPRLGVSPQ